MNRPLPKVSVIIPTFNRACWLKEAIESVFSQSFTDYELIVVDDGSTDDTREMCAQYGDKVRYLFQKNQGSPAARNYGISRARGKYIALLDDDDLWLPDRLKMQVEVMGQDPKLAFVCSSAYAIDEHHNILRQFGLGVSADMCDFEHLILGNFVLHLTVLVRKDIVLEMGGYDHNLKSIQDFDLWIRVAKKHPFVYLKEPLAYYRIHANNISNNLEQALADHVRLLNKKEIVGNLSFFKLNRIRARYFLGFANSFAKDKQFNRAKICILRALMLSPVIGRHFWPEDLQNERHTFLKRIVRPYAQLIKYQLNLI